LTIASEHEPSQSAAMPLRGFFLFGPLRFGRRRFGARRVFRHRCGFSRRKFRWVADGGRLRRGL